MIAMIISNTGEPILLAGIVCLLSRYLLKKDKEKYIDDVTWMLLILGAGYVLLGLYLITA